jgi:hypothetical protein
MTLFPQRASFPGQPSIGQRMGGEKAGRKVSQASLQSIELQRLIRRSPGSPQPSRPLQTHRRQQFEPTWFGVALASTIPKSSRSWTFDLRNFGLNWRDQPATAPWAGDYLDHRRNPLVHRLETAMLKRARKKRNACAT